MNPAVGGASRPAGKRAERAPGRTTPRHPAVVGYAVAGLAAGACYSSFLAAPPLGSRLSMADSYVSELEAPGQPARTLFRLTDLVAALLILVLAVALFNRVRPEGRSSLGCLFLAGVGLSSLADGLDPMPCAPSISEACRRRLDEVPIITQLHQRHTLFGVVGVCAAVLAMLLLGSSGRVRRWQPRLGRESRVGGLVLAALVCAEVPLAVRGHGIGAVERLHVLLISAWIVGLGWQLFRSPPRPKHVPAASSASAPGRATGWPRPWKTATSTSSTGRGWGKSRSSR
jgi:hypothetical protein